MKPTFLKFAALLAVVIFLMPSCKKDKTKTELLTTGSWRATAATAKSSSATIDIFSQLSPCDKDDIYTYVTGGVYKEDEGATKCSTSAPQTNTGTWTFTDAESKITLSLSGSSNIVNVVALDDNTLKLSYTLTVSGVSYLYETTFVH